MEKAVDGDDVERTAKAERELERQKELTVGTRVRLVNTATQKAELRGARNARCHLEGPTRPRKPPRAPS